MKAVIFKKYGSPDVLTLSEVEKPIPKESEVLVKVFATTVTLFDCWMRSSTSPPGFGLLMRMATGIRKPKQPILGTEFAGEVSAVGTDVKRFKEGDQVFGFTGMGLGAYAEYICLPEDGMLELKPANMTCEEAAAVPQGALTALYFLRKGNIKRGDKVLIFGASGGVGSYAVQLAKQFEAEVSGVCSPAKMEFVRSLGADNVIDYMQEDFTRSGKIYDIIFDTVGKSPFSGSVRSLKKGGFYLFSTFGLVRFLRILWLKMTSSRKSGPLGVVEEKGEDLIYLKELIEAGKIKPVIDKRYPLEQAAAAHRYVETGQKKGQVVIFFREEE